MHALTFCTPELSHLSAAWSAAQRAAGLIPIVDYVASRGSWQANTNLKPSVILDNAHLFPLIYSDIDALVLPSLPTITERYDVGILGDKTNPSRPFSSLLWLNDGCVPFLRYWARLASCHPTRVDHPLMVQAYIRTKRDVRFLDLTERVDGHWIPNGLR